MSAEPVPRPEVCFHCGLGIPRGVELYADLLGELRPMCCVGCLAVAEMLEAGGLESWYQRREAPTGVPSELPEEVNARTEYLDAMDLEAEYGLVSRDGRIEASLLVEGLSCAACVWVIERHMESLEGVRSVHVGLASHRVTVISDVERFDLRELIARLAEIGFTARPDRPDLAARMERGERRQALIRLGVAGLGTMNVMTYAVALYVGAIDGMQPSTREFLRWMCLLVTTPVVLIGARPFFEGALRDLRTRQAGMDVPVALSIGGAYLASALAVVRGTGEVYFESACMFTFFLGIGRYLEMTIRHRSAESCRRMLGATPPVARRIDEAGERIVPARALRVGDRFILRAGETLAADGIVVEGQGSVEEALLTGEPWPKSVLPGSRVIAGSVNAESPLVVEATRVGAETSIASVMSLIERAQSDKPAVARMADRVARYFVSGVIGVAAITAIVWGVIEPQRAIWVTLSVLVATCPCALSLATPTALSAATEGLAKAGLLITRGHVLEGLARATRMVFDKTGTLTCGEPALVRILPLRGDSEEHLIALARSLESRSEHVIARAFTSSAWSEGRCLEILPSDLIQVPGRGIEARLNSVRHRIGKPEWVLQLVGGSQKPALPEEDSHSWILLADEQGPLAWFAIDDPLRPEALESTRRLSALGLSLEMLSGDPSPAVERIARRLRFAASFLALTPSDKVDRIRALHDLGERIVAIGDGVNDSALMRAADVSIAMGSGADLTRISSDAVLVSDDLSRIPLAIRWARRTRRVILQNFAWAIGYNLFVLPLAVTGHLAPWVAALGMSISSLVVVLNATRLSRISDRS